MAYASCPTDVVSAPLEVVWGLLTSPAEWGDFFDLRVLGVDPAGTAKVGQRLWGESGPSFLHLKIAFQYKEIDAEHHRLVMDVTLPFGVRVLEDLDCVRLSATSCRVNYHCNFDFPTGWRGRLVQKLMGRELDTGPVDSLQRLKRAAEAKVAIRPTP